MKLNLESPHLSSRCNELGSNELCCFLKHVQFILSLFFDRLFEDDNSVSIDEGVLTKVHVIQGIWQIGPEQKMYSTI